MMIAIRILVITTAFLVSAAVIAVKKKVHILDAVGVTTGALLILLYFLAMVRHLSVIDWIAGGILALTAGTVLYRTAVRKESDAVKKDLKEMWSKLLTPELIVFLIYAIVITVLVKDEVFSWWDDINYWSSDAKALYYLGGFPGKYGNVSPEFGDYPPMTSLFKWLFLHFSPSYIQGLQFAGYYVLNALFLLPLTKKAGKANGAVRILFTLSVFMIPTIVSGFVAYGTPSDVTMGIVYGALLLAIWDHKDIEEKFYYGRIAIYTAVLLLTKNVGIEWAIFAFVFYFLVNGIGKKQVGRILAAALPAGAVYGSWLGFCLLNRRVAKLTGAGLKMAASATSGGYSAPDNAILKMQYFLKGFAFIPMHTNSNVTIDLSTLALVVIFFGILGAFRYFKVIGDRKLLSRLLLYFVFTGLAAYGIIFLAHITIFATEEQYLDAAQMALSIARYGAPFELGGLYLLMGILMEHYAATVRATRAVIACLVFTSLTADYHGIYEALVGYHAVAEDRADIFQSTIDEDGKIFIEKVEGNTNLYGHRILFLRDAGINHQIKDAYISNEVSPIPVVYYDFYAEGEWADTPESVAQKIKESHAEYLYVQRMPSNSNTLFDTMTEGNAFQEEHLYRITTDENGALSLTEP